MLNSFGGVRLSDSPHRGEVRSVPMPRTMKPTAITKRNTTGQIRSPPTKLLSPSRMNAPPMQTYHQASMRVRRFLFSSAEGSWRTTQVLSRLMATPHRLCSALPLLRDPAGSILSDAWNARNGAHYAIHCCPCCHAAPGGWQCIVRKDPGPPAETARHQVSQRGDAGHAAASLNRRPSIARMLRLIAQPLCAWAHSKWRSI